MQRQHGEIIAGESIRECRLHAADFGKAGQEDQCVASLFGDRLQHGLGDAILDALGRAPRGIAEMTECHRKDAPFAADLRGIRQQRADRRDVERRRHDQQAQIGAQARLGFQRQRQREIAVERALVKLVEHDRSDAFELGIALQLPQEEPGGDALDPRFRPDAPVEADPVADRFADRLGHQLGHPLGGGPGGEVAGAGAG